ncbi:MAG: glycosyltransferase [Comamonadaceae bacterium]|nr:MAG: glycosyltransferase [Comamonadaceae bacterium]
MARTPLQPLAIDELAPGPRVSVAIASYNYARYLPECLDSCLAQTVKVDEIVIVDDGSSDASWAVIQSYMDRFAHIRGSRQSNAGICATTNAALAGCTGDVVLLLDSDDAMLPIRVERVLGALRERIDGHLPGWVHHSVQRFSGTHENLGNTPHYGTDALCQGFLVDHVLDTGQTVVSTVSSGLSFRREVIAAVGPLDEHRVMNQDLQFWIAASLMSPVAWIAEPLSRYRMHGKSVNSGGTMSTLAKVRTALEQEDRLGVWIRALLERSRPDALARWKPASERLSYQWLRFLERWWSGSGKDFSLLFRILRDPETRAASTQQRMYVYSSVFLPQRPFLAFSRFIFGSSPAKTMLRRLLGRA